MIGVFLAATAASAGDLGVVLDCPDAADVGTSPSIDVTVENRSCSPRVVRLLSTVVGNGAGSIGGLSILGPDVLANSIPVPGATDLLSGVCTGNTCDGSFRFCTTNADCSCVEVQPGTSLVSVAVAAPIPASFAETVIEQFTFVDSSGTGDKGDESCRIAVPEPSFGSLVWSGICAGGILGLSGRGQNRRARKISTSASRARSTQDAVQEDS